MIVAYLPEPHKHPLWNDIERLIRQGTDEDANVLDENELVWIAFEGTTLFAAGTFALIDDEAWLLAAGGFEHRDWIGPGTEVAVSWARDCGARRLMMRGRKGWARALRGLGWDAAECDDGKWLFEKVLTNE